MNEPDYEYQNVVFIRPKVAHPVDTGWAWVICFGSFIGGILVSGFARTTGMFFIEICDTFHAEKTEVSWIFSLFYVVSNMSAPLGVFLATKMSARIAVIVATVCSSGGLMICSFAPTYTTFFFSYSFLIGFFQGIIMTTLITILGDYFDKRNSLAMGIMFAGGSFGGLTLPALIQLIINELGFRNMLMIQSAIYLNGLVIAALFRPPSIYEKWRPNCEESIQLKATNITEVECLERENTPPPQNSTCSKLLASINTKLLKNPSLYILMFAFQFKIFSYVSSYFLIPIYAKELGISQNERTFLIFIMGFPDLIARILTGYLADLKNAPHIVMYMVAMVVLAAAFSLVTLIGTFSAMIAFAIFAAFFGGSAWTLVPIIMRTTLGPKNMPTAMALSLTLTGPILLSSAPILTIISRELHSWAWSCRFVSIVILLSCLTLAMQLIYERCRSRKRSSSPPSNS